MENVIDTLWNEMKSKPIEKIDENDGEPFIVFDTYDKTVKVLCFNNYHDCWDGEDGDDYYCDLNRVSHWMPFPKKPKAGAN